MENVALLGTSRNRLRIAFRKPGQQWEVCSGRVAQALTLLATKGEAGLTSLEVGNARLSAAIYRLRREHSLTIETETENHSGQFPSHHGKYILRTPIELGNVDLPDSASALAEMEAA